MIKLTPELNPEPAHKAIVDAIAKALEEAEFGYSFQLTRLVDGESTYTLRYDDGTEPIEFDDIDDGYAHVAEKKRLTQALAVLTTLVRLGWQTTPPAPTTTPTKQPRGTPGPWEFDQVNGHIYHRPNPLTKIVIATLESGKDEDGRLIASLKADDAHLRQRIDRLIDPDYRVRAAEERAIAAEKKAGSGSVEPIDRGDFHGPDL